MNAKMESFDIEIPAKPFCEDFTIIYKGKKQHDGKVVDSIEEIKTSKDIFLGKLLYFKDKENELKYIDEIYIHDKYYVDIFREFICSLKTNHVKVDDTNYHDFYNLSLKYQFHELQK